MICQNEKEGGSVSGFTKEESQDNVVTYTMVTDFGYILR